MSSQAGFAASFRGTRGFFLDDVMEANYSFGLGVVLQSKFTVKFGQGYLGLRYRLATGSVIAFVSRKFTVAEVSPVK